MDGHHCNSSIILLGWQCFYPLIHLRGFTCITYNIDQMCDLTSVFVMVFYVEPEHESEYNTTICCGALRTLAGGIIEALSCFS